MIQLIKIQPTKFLITMHHIQLGLHLNEKLGLKSVSIDFNSTDLNNDSKLLEILAFTILRGLKINKDSVLVQDLLNELNIETETKKKL